DVKSVTFTQSITLTGVIGSDEEANISTKIPGRVTGVHADEGMIVNKDQTLVTIDDLQLKIQKSQVQNQIVVAQTNIDTIKLQLNDAERDLQRMEQLFKENAISQKQLESYQLKLNTLKNNYESAIKNLQVVKDNLKLIETQIDDCTIRAPFSGIMGIKNVDIGEIVAPGQVLMTLFNINKLNVQIKVPENYLPEIKMGQDVIIEIDAVNGRQIIGKVKKISGSPDPKTRMFVVYASLPGSPKDARPGMFVRAKIITRIKQNAIVIPQQAIFQENNKTFVYIVDANKAKKIEVVTGDNTDDTIEIISGLKPGEKVITSNLENLSHGTIIKITERESNQ
ncbi:MAG TPA: efflux RND transporter periplasmic adaptor subunit, partial [bacterium]|nr:efflux RND transporter periplasmic adaptor subunit [bacterium]